MSGIDSLDNLDDDTLGVLLAQMDEEENPPQTDLGKAND